MNNLSKASLILILRNLEHSISNLQYTANKTVRLTFGVNAHVKLATCLYNDIVICDVFKRISKLHSKHFLTIALKIMLEIINLGLSFTFGVFCKKLSVFTRKFHLLPCLHFILGLTTIFNVLKKLFGTLCRLMVLVLAATQGWNCLKKNIVFALT